MAVLRAAWFILTFPLRAFYWLIWQVRRGAIAVVGGLQRSIGQRSVLLLFSAVITLFGIGLAVGWIDCSSRSRGCIEGLEVPMGALFAAFGGYLTFVAVRRVPNVRAASVTPDFDYLKYDPKDWDLSWRSVGFVGCLVVLTVAVVALIYATA